MNEMLDHKLVSVKCLIKYSIKYVIVDEHFDVKLD